MYKSKYIRIVFTVLAVAFALPLQWNRATGLFNWLSPFLLLNSLFVLKSVVLLNSLGFAVLIISFFRKRWFCRYLCPLGLACDEVSKRSKRKAKYLAKIPELGRWIYIISFVAALFEIPVFILLDPMAIFHGFFSIFAEPFSWLVFVSMIGLPFVVFLHLFFPKLWCGRICPLGGLFDDLFLLRKVFSKKSAADPSDAPGFIAGRRLFLTGATGIVAGVFLPKFLSAGNTRKFKPPAASPEPLFSTLCVRCGSCIKACPGNVLRHDTGNYLSWMTPELTFDRGGYCHEDCNVCGTVCPSGSISPFLLSAKKHLHIARIEIGLDKCLLTQQTECDRCKAVCSYDAIKIVPTALPLIMKPVADEQKCVGCGACAIICPEETIKMSLPEI